MSISDMIYKPTSNYGKLIVATSAFLFITLIAYPTSKNDYIRLDHYAKSSISLPYKKDKKEKPKQVPTSPLEKKAEEISNKAVFREDEQEPTKGLEHDVEQPPIPYKPKEMITKKADKEETKESTPQTAIYQGATKWSGKNRVRYVHHFIGSGFPGYWHGPSRQIEEYSPPVDKCTGCQEPEPPIVPEPLSAILFISGAAVLGTKRFFKKRASN